MKMKYKSDCTSSDSRSDAYLRWVFLQTKADEIVERFRQLVVLRESWRVVVGDDGHDAHRVDFSLRWKKRVWDIM